MNAHRIGFVICLLAALLTAAFCGAEELSTTTYSGSTYAILLPADDGYQSIAEAGGVPISDVVDLYVAVLENYGNSVLLQGATTNNNSSVLRYRTGHEQKIDWSRIPKHGNEATLSSTIGGLNKDNYNSYERVIVLTGRLESKNNLNRKDIQAMVPTWLVQVVPFSDGTSLLDDYAKIAGLKYGKKETSEKNHFETYTISKADSGIQSEILKYQGIESYSGELLLHDLLMETVFDGYCDIDGASIGFPGTLANRMSLMIIGDNLTDLQFVSPDGGIYSILPNTASDHTILKTQEFKFGEKQAILIDIDSNSAKGTWKITGAEHIENAKLYYLLRSDYEVVMEDLPFIKHDYNESAMPKGTTIFSLSDDPMTQDLTRLYPNSKLKVTDTVADALVEEQIGEDQNPYQVGIKFQKGGIHLLTFRLMDGDHEILKRSEEVNVEDKAPQMLIKNGAEIRVLYDTYKNKLWQQDVSEWFTDEDGDQITITRIGGDSQRVKLNDNILSFQAGENEIDSSEDVRLQVRSDTKEFIANVRIVWRSLRNEIENSQFKCTIIPDNPDGSFIKRAPVHVEVRTISLGEDKNEILNQLSACEASIIDDQDNIVASVSFSEKDIILVSDSFALPDKSGDYSWIIHLHSPEDSLPVWSLKLNSDYVTIENHSPEAHPELLSAQEETGGLFGDQYYFSPTDWKLTIPEGLVTDPDGDPVTYKILVDGKEYINEESPMEIQLQEFGKHDLVIQGCDNQNAFNITELSYHVILHDEKQELETSNAALSIQPVQEEYPKREEVVLILQINNEGWPENKRIALNHWYKDSDTKVIQNEMPLNDVKVEYSEESMRFLSTPFAIPENQGEYSYHIEINNSETQPTEVHITGNDPITITVGNKIPQFKSEGEEITEYSDWVMDAQKYDKVVVKADLVIDMDKDPITREIVLKKGGNELNRIQDDNMSDYTFQFEAMDFFTFSDHYTAEITFTDNDGAELQYNIEIELKNKLLLIVIIVAAAILAASVIVLIVYIRYRSNLPSFSGSIVFIQNDQQPVSPEIDLSVWGKQKSIPLPVFAGSISVLLSDKQWDEIKKLELRPDKNTGYKLCGGEDKKKAESKKMPYTIAEELKICDASHSRMAGNDSTTRT